MTHVTCRLTAKNRDQLRNPTLGNRVWASFTFFGRRQIRLNARDTAPRRIRSGTGAIRLTLEVRGTQRTGVKVYFSEMI